MPNDPTTPTPPNPDLVLGAGIPAFAPDYEHMCLPERPHLPMDCPAEVHNPEATDRRPLTGNTAELQASIDLRGADDDRPVTEQRLTGQDRATLRWFAGKHTLQDWLDKAPEDRTGTPPHLVVKRDVPLRMAARLKAVQDAQTMVRLCPSAYIPEVRP